MAERDDLIVRPAQLADASSIAAIYAHHVAHGTASFDTTPRTDAETAAKIAECAAKGWPYLVAEAGREVVGYAYATQFRDRPAYTSTCENSIYVAASHIGQGVGRSLLAALVEAARQAGFRQMIAVVGGAEPASIAAARARRASPMLAGCARWAESSGAGSIRSTCNVAWALATLSRQGMSHDR